MKTLLTIGLIISAGTMSSTSYAQAYNKSFAESEKQLAVSCINTYQNAPKDGALILSSCGAKLTEMKALKNRTSGLTDIDMRMFYLYSAMTNAILTVADLTVNDGRVSPASCVHGREAIRLAKKINFNNGSKFDAIVKNMITGFQKELIPHCKSS